jgi:acetyl-CoA carboxylase biotin carboxyl carrier protein
MSDIREKVKSLYEIMYEEKIRELEVSSKNYSVCIKRKSPNRNDNQVVCQQCRQVVEEKYITYGSDRKKDSLVLSETIKSPITGIFYRAPSPSLPAFVNEGDIVECGKVVCIIEAMKVINEIKTTSKVKILKVLVDNGQAVNSGQNLFEVEEM